MTFVVTESCIKCKYTDCVEVCPVDCFHEGPNMLVIDPEDCIDCAMCETECPVNAIVSEDDGASWSGEIVIRGDLPNGNLGYPAAIEYQPGRLFTAYYGEDHDGVTCIQGTWFDV